MNADLDETVDEQRWVKEHPVYCPIPWCSAHKLRFVRCGDDDGEYVGIHAARIKYVATFTANEQRRFRLYKELGLDFDQKTHFDVSRMTQDAIDHGLLPGRRGRRRV